MTEVRAPSTSGTDTEARKNKRLNARRRQFARPGRAAGPAPLRQVLDVSARRSRSPLRAVREPGRRRSRPVRAGRRGGPSLRLDARGPGRSGGSFAPEAAIAEALCAALAETEAISLPAEGAAEPDALGGALPRRPAPPPCLPGMAAPGRRRKKPPPGRRQSVEFPRDQAPEPPARGNPKARRLTPRAGPGSPLRLGLDDRPEPRSRPLTAVNRRRARGPASAELPAAPGPGAPLRCGRDDRGAGPGRKTGLRPA